MQDGRHARGGTSTLEFEDVVTVDLPDDGYVDREFLRDVFRDPHTYLPLRRRRPRDLEDLPKEVESAFARRAKLTGLLSAVIAVIGAVVAAAALAERPTRSSGAADERLQRSVTDIDALGAFSVAEAGRLGGVGRASGTAPPTPRAQPARPQTTPRESTARTAEPAKSGDPGGTTTPQPTTSREDHGESTEGSSSPGSTTEDTSTPDTAVQARSADVRDSVGRTSANQVTSRLETVRRFYSLVESSPDQALGMLAPGLLDNALNELRAAWGSLEDVQVVAVREHADRSVLAVVTMRHSDGSEVRMTQLFDFAAGGRIDHVQLLSAQHS